MGGSFAVWGGLFASFDCTLMYVRQREDHWNAIAAGALTGGVLSARMGANAAFRSAVMGGVILVRSSSFSCSMGATKQIHSSSAYRIIHLSGVLTLKTFWRNAKLQPCSIVVPILD